MNPRATGVLAIVVILCGCASSARKFVTVSPTSQPAQHVEILLPADTRPPPRVLTIEADIDGSDELHVSTRGLTWTHKQWSWPGRIHVNGLIWKPQTDPELLWSDIGIDPFPDDLKPGHVRTSAREARDTLGVETVADGIVVFFSDTPNGAAPYRITIELGALEESACASP